MKRFRIISRGPVFFVQYRVWLFFWRYAHDDGLPSITAARNFVNQLREEKPTVQEYLD